MKNIRKRLIVTAVVVVLFGASLGARQPYSAQIQQALNQLTNGAIAFITLGMQASSYINFGTPQQASGYGIRDNAGVIETKNSGGAWAPISTTSGITTLTFSGGSVLDGSGTNTILQRNSTSAQRFNVSNTYTSSISNELFSVDWQTTGNVATIGTRTAATGTGRTAAFVAQSSNASASYAGFLADRTSGFSIGGNTALTVMGFFSNVVSIGTIATAGITNSVIGYGTNTATSGTAIAAAILPTYSQASGNTANTDLLINRTQTAVGSGTQLLLDAQVGGTSRGNLSNIGVLTLPGTTYTNNEAVLAIAGTWNDAADTFKGIDVNITNTNSAAASSLLDLRLGGTSLFNFRKDGTLILSTAGINSAGGINILANASAQLAGRPFVTNTAPTNPVACTSPTVTNSNGTVSALIDVGTTCAGISTLVVTLPAMTQPYICYAVNTTTSATAAVEMTASTTTSATFTNYTRTTGIALNWVDGADIRIGCLGG